MKASCKQRSVNARGVLPSPSTALSLAIAADGAVLKIARGRQQLVAKIDNDIVRVVYQGSDFVLVIVVPIPSAVRLEPQRMTRDRFYSFDCRHQNGVDRLDIRIPKERLLAL